MMIFIFNQSRNVYDIVLFVQINHSSTVYFLSLCMASTYIDLYRLESNTPCGWIQNICHHVEWMELLFVFETWGQGVHSYPTKYGTVKSYETSSDEGLYT